MRPGEGPERASTNNTLVGRPRTLDFNTYTGAGAWPSANGGPVGAGTKLAGPRAPRARSVAGSSTTSRSRLWELARAWSPTLEPRARSVALGSAKTMYRTRRLSERSPDSEEATEPWMRPFGSAGCLVVWISSDGREQSPMQFRAPSSERSRLRSARDAWVLLACTTWPPN